MKYVPIGRIDEDEEDNRDDTYSPEYVIPSLSELTSSSAPYSLRQNSEERELLPSIEELAGQQIQTTFEEPKENDDLYKNLGDSYERWNYGSLEAARAIAQGTVATIAGGWGAIGTWINNKLGIMEDDPSDVMRSIQEDLSYVPKTDEGKSIIKTISYPGVLIHDTATYIADKVFDKTSSPGAATATGTIIELFAPTILIKSGISVAKNTKSAVKSLNVASKSWRKGELETIVKNENISAIKEMPNAEVNLQKTAYLEQNIPGLKLTQAEATGSNVSAIKQQMLASGSEHLKRAAQNVIDANALAIKKYYNNVFGSKDIFAGEMASIIKKSQGDDAKAIEFISRKQGELLNKAIKLADDNRMDNVKYHELGKAHRDTYNKLYTLAKEKGALLYKPIDNVPVKVNPVYQKLNSFFDQNGYFYGVKPEDVPGTIKFIGTEYNKLIPKAPKILDYNAQPKPFNPDVNTDFATLRSWTTQVGGELAQYRSKGTSYLKETKALSELYETLKTTMSQLKNNPDPSVYKNYEIATNYWNKEVVERFYSANASKVNMLKINGKEYEIIDESVMDTWFAPKTKTSGGASAIKDFIKTFGDDPDAWAQLDTFVFKKMADTKGVITDKGIDSSLLQKFMNDYREQLDFMPVTKNKLSTLHSAVDFMNETAVKLRVKESQYQLSQTAMIVKEFAKGGVDPSYVIHKAMNDVKLMRQIKIKARQLGPEAEAGLSKFIADYVTVKSGSSAKIEAFVLDNKNAHILRTGMGDEHYTALKIYAEAKNRANFKLDRSLIEQDPGLLGMIKETTGFTGWGIANLLRNKDRLGLSNTTVFGQIGSGVLMKMNKRTLTELEYAAYFDLDAAKLLRDLTIAKKTSPKLEAQTMKTLTRLGLLQKDLIYKSPIAGGYVETTKENIKEEDLYGKYYTRK